MANRIQLRRGGAQEWQNANPILAQGELGIELDTGRIKIGDGVTAWNTLRYERPVESVSNTANTLVQRDADGNFQAGTITATVIGNASTATRLASSRQIQLLTDVQGSGIFDGSSNLNINAELQLVPTLPHYDGTATPTGTYTKVTVDAKGRITNASNPTTLAEYGLNTGIEGTGAQPYDNDLNAISGLTTTGLISRTSTGNMSTRTITGTATRIAINDGGGINGNPTIDLITTAVTAGDYNTESLTSVSSAGSNSEPYGTETVNATKFTVDAYGRLTNAVNVPIATATEGSKYPNYSAGTAYSRYAIIQNASKVYQAIADISAGAGAPTHSSGDSGSWRYLAAEATEQKGLASFAQEDFDVDSNGHVTIAALGVDNTQLQNNRVSFADGNTKEDFELDQELTATTGYRGFNYLNYVKINDTSGNLLFGANNTGDSGAGEIDVNVRSYFSDPDITLDGAVNQTLSKTGDGNLTIGLSNNTSSNRNLTLTAINAGSGTSNIIITAEDTVQISASDAAGKVHVEDSRFQDNYIATTNATMHLDPGDDRAVTGLVRVWGDLQVDGTTTTVNSTVMTVDDPIITLGGDTAPASDDNKDRGVEFRYYDSQARLGFYGWDTNYTDLAGHEGGFTFLHAATNTSEVFTGTASGITAGNLKLTTNTNSTSNTTGDLVVAGGVGIGDDVNIGGLLDVDGTFRANSTSRFDDNIVLQGASKTLQLNNGSGTTKIEFQSTTGNASIGGVTDITGNLNVNTNKFNVVAASGNTTIAGTLGVTGIATFSNNIDANGDVAIAGNIHSESTNDITVAKNSGTGVWEIQSNDYGSLRVDGGMYAAGDALIDGTLHVNGAIEVKDSATEAESRLNWLRVRYRGRFGDSYQATPSYASHNTTTLRAHGGAGIERTLHVGGTGSGEGLFVGKKNNGDTVKFSVLGASGNTDIQGTLDVNGATEITNTLDVSNAVTFDQTLTVTGNSEFNGTVDVDADFAVRNGTTDKFTVDNVTGNTVTAGTLTVDGETNITDTVNISANGEFFKVRNGSNANKFTVDTDNGNTEVMGTLEVDGETRINDTLRIRANNESFVIENNSGVDKFTVDSDNGNTNIIGTVTVGDATQINDTLGVSGVTSITANSQQTLTGNYGADGAFRLTGGAGIQKNLAVGGDARIYGATELTGALDLNSNANISGTLTQGGVSTFHSNLSITAGNGGATKFSVASASGNTDLRGTLDVGGDVTAESNLTVTGNLTVNGTTTTVNSTVTTLDDPIITVGGDTAPSTNDGKDRGVEFRYYDGSAKIGFFGYDRSANQFAFLTSATNNSEVLTGTDGALRAGSLNLTGSGTALDVDANANIDGTLTVDGQIISQVSSGPALVIPNTTKINNLNADLLDSMTTASTNTVSTVVNRDSSGNFSAGTITADLTGNADTATTLETARDIILEGVVTGTVSFNGSQNVSITTSYSDSDITALAAQTGTGLVTRTATGTYAQRTLMMSGGGGIAVVNGNGVLGNPTINVASTPNNSANNLVLRDASGNFAAGTITASLTGNVTGDVTGDLTGDVTGTVSSIANHDTGDLTEGTNLYYTDARADARIAAADTGDLTEGSNLYFTNARADARVAAATGANLDLSQKSTTDLSEGTNLYYTEARVQDKLDNAFEQLTAMLNNLANTTTLVLNLSGDPTPGDVTAFNNASLSGGTGYNTTTSVATTSNGSGTGLLVDITASGGVITAVGIRSGGSGYAVGETITITGGGGNATIDVSAVVEMAIGDTVTGGTSGTTGIITAVGATSVTVDNVDGFFKKTETVSAGDVTTLTISSFG